MKHALKPILKMRQRLGWKPCGLDSNVNVIVSSFNEAFTMREDDGKDYSYPETIEVKIENWSNHWYSVRTSDGRWIREGQDLSGPGLSAGQVYRRMLNELKNRKPKLGVVS